MYPICVTFMQIRAGKTFGFTERSHITELEFDNSSSDSKVNENQG